MAIDLLKSVQLGRFFLKSGLMSRKLSKKPSIWPVMKLLFIVRHAKSSWDNPSLRDFDRPLNGRGKRNVPDMGARLKGLNIAPDLLLSSPANRAITTARGIAKALDYPLTEIEEAPVLYHASTSTIISQIARVDAKVNTLMIFGHNPGFTDLIETLSDFELYNLPTCAVCGIRFKINDWGEILNAQGEKFYYDYPKSRDV